MSSSDPSDTLVRLYRSAWLDILDRLATKEAKGSAAAFERAMLADVQAILLDLDSGARQWIEQQLPRIYQGGQSEVVKQLAQAGLVGDAFRTSFAGAHMPAVEVLANNMYADLTDAHSMVGRRVQDMFRQAGLEATARKVSSGQTIKEMQASLRQQLADRGAAAFVDSRGASWGLDTYAEMVARTTSREATNLGRINQQTQLGYDLVRIPPHTPTCEICAVYQNRIYSVSGKDKRYPALYATAFRSGYHTIHPRCGHVAVCWPEALATAAEKRDALEASSRPFEDNRGVRERDAYLQGQEVKRGMRQDRNQWMRYRAVLPDDTPTFGGFRRMKAADSERYQELQALYREAGQQVRAAMVAKPQPQPQGTPVSAAFTSIPGGKVGAAVHGSLDAIGQVHGDGSLPEIPVKTTAGKRATGGYAYTTSGTPIEIRLSSKSEHPLLDMTHEIGHFLDQQAIGSGKFASEDWRFGSIDPALKEAFKSWADSVQGSEAVQSLRDLYRHPTIRVETEQGTETYRADLRYIAYLLKDEEIFARSYAQYIAVRSGDAGMLNEITSILNPGNGELAYPRQWSDQDFEPVAQALDGLFAVLGWRQ